MPSCCTFDGRQVEQFSTGVLAHMIQIPEFFTVDGSPWVSDEDLRTRGAGTNFRGRGQLGGLSALSTAPTAPTFALNY